MSVKVLVTHRIISHYYVVFHPLYAALRVIIWRFIRLLVILMVFRWFSQPWSISIRVEQSRVFGKGCWNLFHNTYRWNFPLVWSFFCSSSLLCIQTTRLTIFSVSSCTDAVQYRRDMFVCWCALRQSLWFVKSWQKLALVTSFSCYASHFGKHEIALLLPLEYWTWNCVASHQGRFLPLHSLNFGIFWLGFILVSPFWYSL